MNGGISKTVGMKEAGHRREHTACFLSCEGQEQAK